jgi:hypothetical protein
MSRGNSPSILARRGDPGNEFGLWLFLSVDVLGEGRKCALHNAVIVLTKINR